MTASKLFRNAKHAALDKLKFPSTTKILNLLKNFQVSKMTSSQRKLHHHLSNLH